MRRGDATELQWGRRTFAATLRRAPRRWPAILLLLFLATNLAHNSPLNLSTGTLQVAAQIVSHGHTHDTSLDDVDGDAHVHVHPVADRVVATWIHHRFIGPTPLYQRTTRIALRWPSTIPLKPPSLLRAA